MNERAVREGREAQIAILDRSLEDLSAVLCSLCSALLRALMTRWRRLTGRLESAARLRRSSVIMLRESLNQPLLVIFEDLHWIDEHTRRTFAEPAGRLD